jgi:hypothetical protein
MDLLLKLECKRTTLVKVAEEASVAFGKYNKLEDREAQIEKIDAGYKLIEILQMARLDIIHRGTNSQNDKAYEVVCAAFFTETLPPSAPGWPAYTKEIMFEALMAIDRALEDVEQDIDVLKGVIWPVGKEFSKANHAMLKRLFEKLAKKLEPIKYSTLI